MPPRSYQHQNPPPYTLKNVSNQSWDTCFVSCHVPTKCKSIENTSQDIKKNKVETSTNLSARFRSLSRGVETSRSRVNRGSNSTQCKSMPQNVAGGRSRNLRLENKENKKLMYGLLSLTDASSRHSGDGSSFRSAGIEVLS